MITGYHAVYENNYFEGIDNASTYGFEFVQFDLGIPKFFLDDLSVKDLTKISDYAREKNVIITFHAPGDNVSLFCDYPLIRDGIIKQFKMIIEKANILKARHITIHTGAYPMFKKSGIKSDDYTSEYKDYYENILYENLMELIINKANTLICLENYYFNTLTINVAKKIINNGYSLDLTLDIAKIYTKNFQINKEVFDFYTKYKGYVRELHIHDMNEQFGSHQILGTGIVDLAMFKEFIQNDNTFINFEIRPIEAAIISKEAFFQKLI
jgi:sugar phosphate isomerase/epimerase